MERPTFWALPSSVIVNHSGPNGTATLDSVFAGASLSGRWTLYVTDDGFNGGVGSLAQWGLRITYNVTVKPDDFNGNKFSDILWQNDNGTPAVWLMNGTNAASVSAIGPFAPFPTNPGPGWHIKDDGDFDGDGKSDVLWQNDDGTPAVWLMNGLTAGSTGALSNPGPSWQIKATGDFNFDTKADILWQNSDGTPAIWLMDGLNLIGGGVAGPNPGPTWQIKDTGASTTTAGPTSSGRTTMARRPSG